MSFGLSLSICMPINDFASPRSFIRYFVESCLLTCWTGEFEAEVVGLVASAKRRISSTRWSRCKFCMI